MSSLKIGIVGLPNVGKSTLFNALTRNNVLAANYPFATIEPNTGIVPVPDERINRLSELFGSAKTVPATVTFVDIAGIVAGAHEGEGMGNAFLSHIRETDAIAQVVRAFSDDDVQHVDDEASPEKDIGTINTELILADLATLEKHLPKLTKEVKRDPKQKPILDAVESIMAELDKGTLAINSSVDLDKISYLNLLTTKPLIYVFNLDDTEVDNDELKQKLTTLAPTDNVVFVSAKVEAEIAQLDGEDAELFMAEYGLEESGLQRLSRVGFDTLGLQTFLTAGPKESKAWTIPRNATAPQAAGAIHNDFQRGFIAADIVSYDDLIAVGSWAKARESGKLRTEGKDYIMQEGDVVEFRFNV